MATETLVTGTFFNCPMALDDLIIETSINETPPIGTPYTIPGIETLVIATCLPCLDARLASCMPRVNLNIQGKRGYARAAVTRVVRGTPWILFRTSSALMCHGRLTTQLPWV